MDRDLRDRWVADLRSGKYVQGEGALSDGERYCCLGVLLDSSGLGEFVGAGDFKCTLPNGALFWMSSDLRVGSGLNPLQVMNHFGIFSDDHDTLTALNDGTRHEEYNPDGAKLDFDGIADWIEAHL